MSAWPLPKQARESVAGMIHRALALATPLSPAERAVFTNPRWGVNPNDELRRHGAAVFVLSRPPRGGNATCVTVIVPTPAQLDTMRIANEAAEEARNGDAFCAALIDYFVIRDAATADRIRSVIVQAPHSLDDLLDLLPAIQATGAEQIERVGARYFWGAYTDRTHKSA